MVRFAALNICLFLSANVFANSPARRCSQFWEAGQLKTACQVFVSKEAVLNEVTVRPANTTSNPNYSSYEVSAMAVLGSNKCQAAGLNAQFVKKHVGGKNILVALIQGWRPENRSCSMEYEPVLVPLTSKVSGYNNAISNIFIKNVDELGTHVAVNSSCFELVMCSMEYQPYICHSAELDREFKGNNQCIAQTRANRSACHRKIELSDLVCEPVSSNTMEPF